MLKLIPETLTPENPTVLLRWCIEKADQEALIAAKAIKPRILIVVLYKNGAEDRHLLPLDQVGAYVGFRFPGTHKVFAMLVWSKQPREMMSTLLQRSDPMNYNKRVINFDGEGFYHFDGVRWECFEIDPAEPLQVSVDKGHFAPDPPKWWKDYVNLLFDHPAVDQCQFRRRAAISVTLKPFLLLVFLVGAFLCCLIVLIVGVLLLARGLTPLKVFNLEPNEIWHPVDVGSKLTYRFSLWSWEDKQGNPKPWRLFLTPLAGVLYYGLIKYFPGHFSPASVSLGVLVGMGICFGIVNFVAWYANHERKKVRYLNGLSEEEVERIRLEKEDAFRKKVQEAYRVVSCSTDAQAVKLEAIPLGRRTLRLYYQASKRKVCKFYAG